MVTRRTVTPNKPSKTRTSRKTPTVKRIMKKVDEKVLLQRRIKALRHPNGHHVVLGSDPEFFFTEGKKVVGSEHFLGGSGVRYGSTHFIIDGVQAELNPSPSTCRESCIHNMKKGMITLKNHLKDTKSKALPCFDKVTVKISKAELAKLDPEHQVFGCESSMTAYENMPQPALSMVDPLKMRYRSAGGHLHFGGDGNPSSRDFKTLQSKSVDIVKMLDIIVGNTMVLIDRDKGNVKRREMYGRAGEFRLPDHGLEYRTLSNFWFQYCELFSLVSGMSRHVINMMLDNSKKTDYFEAFTSLVDEEDIVNAINKNDFKLAYSNFKKIEPLLMQVTEMYHAPINRITIMPFHYLVSRVEKDGMKSFFGGADSFDYWTTARSGSQHGSYDWLRNTVNAKMLADKRFCKANNIQSLATK